MDLSDITKVASMKRMNTDAEKLREKMARESSKIIKLRVAQDTAYWDLKEKLSSVESEHERLQQNMLDAQMQHETLSAQYQDELRQRPETLNKLASTREICDVLEEYVGRVRGCLRRAAADRAALAETYAGAARRVQAAHAQHSRTAEHAKMHAAALSDKLMMSAEHGTRLAGMAAEARRQAEAAEGAMRAQLQAAADAAAEQRARCDQMAERAATTHAALQERERVIAALQREAERQAADSKAEAEQSAKLRTELQKELEARDAALTAAEARGEAAAGEAARVQLVLAATEERAAHLADDTAKLSAALQNLETINADLKLELETIGSKCEALQKEIEEKEREGRECAVRAETAQRELAEIRAAREEDGLRLRSTLAELEAERDAHAAFAAAAKKDQKALEERSAAAAAAAERTLSERADAMAQLIREVGAEAEARAQCSAALSKARTELEAAARAKSDLENKLESKEKELADQMKIIFETRSEKERLQDKILGMQGTIDNIQKELTRESPPDAAVAASAARREPPEHDDHARAAPSKLHKQGKSARPLKGDRGLFRAPKPCPAAELSFQFLSDSSFEGDVIDHAKVNARFEAMQRGELPPPIPLSELKRAKHPDHSHPHCPAPLSVGNGEQSLSHLKADINERGRSFFRTKRVDGKPRKAK